MIPTTLMTFLYQAPVSAITVELIGSWDRFTKSYPLRRDERTGPGHWRGCHTFTDIICDGDSLDISSSREGGLKMGGKYWYFYRLDGVVEYHNPVEPSTTQCPFLPGQQVNILDVPVQAGQSPSPDGSSTSVVSDLYTLDPKAKYLTPQHSVRRAPLMVSHTNLQTPSAKSISAQVLASNSHAPGRENQFLYQKCVSSSSKAALTQNPQSPSSPTKRLLSAAFCKMRASRSAGLVRQEPKVDQQNSSISDADPFRNGSPALASKDFDVATDFFLGNSAQCSQHILPSALAEMRCTLPHLGHVPSQERFSPLSLGPTEDQVTSNILNWDNLKYLSASSYSTSPKQPLEQIYSSESSSRHRSTLNVTFESLQELNSRQADPTRVQIMQGAKYEYGYHSNDSCGRQSYPGSVLSYATSHLFSPGLASSSVYTDGMSPYHLSQPGTPSISECGDDFLGTNFLSYPEIDVASSNVHGPENLRNTPPEKLNDDAYPDLLGGFQRYCLAETERASAITLRKSPHAQLDSRCSSSLFSKQGSRDLVTSWNDGSRRRITGLGEFLDDLGYLGELIV